MASCYVVSLRKRCDFISYFSPPVVVLGGVILILLGSGPLHIKRFFFVLVISILRSVLLSVSQLFC